MWHLWCSVTVQLIVLLQVYYLTCMSNRYDSNNDVYVDVGKGIPTKILQSTYLNIFEYESGSRADNGCLLTVVLLQRLHWGVDVLQVGEP
jgi:hypothetical protein